MFEKYSTERDLVYSVVFIIILFSIIEFILGINMFIFDTKMAAATLVSLFSVLFGFILTCITILFMFNPSKSSIFGKLQKDGLYGQIFKRFFDSITVVFIALFYFLLISLYFIEKDLVLGKFVTQLSVTINLTAMIILLLTAVKLFRCLNLISLIYSAILYDKGEKN